MSLSLRFHRLIYRWQRSEVRSKSRSQIHGTKIDMKLWLALCDWPLSARRWQLDRISANDGDTYTGGPHIYSPDTVRWTVLINGGWALTWHSYTPPSRSVAELKSSRQSFGFSKASENLESLAYVSRPIVSKWSSSPRLRTQDTWNKKMWSLYMISLSIYHFSNLNFPPFRSQIRMERVIENGDIECL